MKRMKTTKVASVEDWNAVAQDVAKTLRSGMILGLSGPLGAGKTAFVQALARELGANVSPKSPTFSLVRTYQLQATRYQLHRLVHVDAYRIEKPEDVLTLGLDELLAVPGTVMAVEWPENIAAWLSRQTNERKTLRIGVLRDGSRSIRF